MIKDILRLKYQGALSHEAIALNLGISKGVCTSVGPERPAWTGWAATAELDEAALERRLTGRSANEARVVEANFAWVHIGVASENGSQSTLRRWSAVAAA